MTEKWLPIIDWPEYEVSNLGRVRRVATGAIRKPCNIEGYQALRLTRPGGQQKTILIHVEVARRFVKRPRRKGLEVNHIDTNRWNPRADNLEWLTRSGNAKHGYEHGNMCAKGERNGYAKLNEACVFEIRNTPKDEWPALAALRDVGARRTWKHI
jgi:hypothetical protein